MTARLLLASALAAAFLGPAAVHAATVQVSPAAFSPRVGPLRVHVELARPGRMGVALATRSGKRLGWLARPARRGAVDLRWRGRLRGAVVPDGRYLVQILVRGRRVAARPVVVDATAPRLERLRVSSGRGFAGDGRLRATVTPNGDGLRDRAVVLFRLTEPATVRIDVHAPRRALGPAVQTVETRLRAGARRVVWRPAPGLAPGAYLLRLSIVDRLGNRRVYGAERPELSWVPRAPVVRVLGVEAAFARRSYAPGERAVLELSSDAAALSVEILRSGPEAEPTFRNDELKGVPVDAPLTVERHRRDRPLRVSLRIGDWPSGLYFARVATVDGTVGFAPFVVRPRAFGTRRVAVVLPTDTWQAYNFYDGDGNGWGDTWYVSDRIRGVDLRRPHLSRGVPYRFRSYDLAFLRWLELGGRQADYLASEDLERASSGEALAAAYDLIVFSGHHEYVTARAYGLVERYRDLGGNLMFLSANNFFWRVDRRGGRVVRQALWRDLGRPEARLLGVQYLANDDGRRQAPFVVTGAAVLPWAFEGTGLANGDTFGLYGIEIDAVTGDSPPATHVLAAIPDVFGAGRTAQMTYYETPAGAKVFAAGALNFGGSVLPVGRVRDPRITRLLENLWARLSVP